MDITYLCLHLVEINILKYLFIFFFFKASIFIIISEKNNLCLITISLFLSQLNNYIFMNKMDYKNTIDMMNKKKKSVFVTQ